jgi:hypothetical protein
MDISTFHNLGVALATAHRGGAIADLHVKHAFQEELLGDPAFTDRVCDRIGTMYELAGKGTSFERCLLTTLHKEAAVGNSSARALQREFVDSFLDVLADSPTLDKSAAAAAGGVSAALARLGLATTPGALKLLLAAGVMGGTTMGALHWGLNRDSREDGKDISEMQARVDEYNRITDQLSEKLQSKGVRPEDQPAEPAYVR